jgi:hypothetical protein
MVTKMSIEYDIDNLVYSIRHAVNSIRNSDIDTSEIDNDLDSIEYACDELNNLEEEDPDFIVRNALDDMGLGNLAGEQWKHIDVGTENELREAVTRILKEHGYSVG